MADTYIEFDLRYIDFDVRYIEFDVSQPSCVANQAEPAKQRSQPSSVASHAVRLPCQLGKHKLKCPTVNSQHSCSFALLFKILICITLFKHKKQPGYSSHFLSM